MGQARHGHFEKWSNVIGICMWLHHPPTLCHFEIEPTALLLSRFAPPSLVFANSGSHALSLCLGVNLITPDTIFDGNGSVNDGFTISRDGGVGSGL